MNRRAHSRRARSRRGSLVVVGTGISGIGQTTLEAVACIRRADKLFYSVVEPITELWLRQLNPTATSLADHYGEGKSRLTTYAEMTADIVGAVRSGLEVCTAFYGHPGVLVQASHDAISRLRREGYPARMLPGVSADGCLVADLGFNPGDCGIQSYEATDFLLSRKVFDATSGLVLWQIGVLGEFDARRGGCCRPERLERLTRTLLRHYPGQHGAVLYYAATFPADPPVIKRIKLAALPTLAVPPMAMLYVPGLPRRRMARDIARWFEQN